jgi:hypothetical protein
MKKKSGTRASNQLSMAMAMAAGSQYIYQSASCCCVRSLAPAHSRALVDTEQKIQMMSIEHHPLCCGYCHRSISTHTFY